MKKKQSSLQQQQVNGFEGLLNVHIESLQENSDEMAELLELLSGKELSAKDKKDLKSIKTTINRLNKELDNLGDNYNGF